MVQYTHAVFLLVTLTTTSCSHGFVGPATRGRQLSLTTTNSNTRRSVSASQAMDQYDDERKLRETMETLSSSVSEKIQQENEEDDATEAQVQLKKDRMRQRKAPGLVVKVSLNNNAAGSSNNIGLRLCQVESQVVSTQTLDLDTLQYTNAAATPTDSTFETIDASALKERLDDNFRGVVVMSVNTEGQAYAQGVRPGDILVASSATVGDAMWPKTTLEGVQSSITSRKVVADNLGLQFQHSYDVSPVDNQYELTIARPMGIEIDENKDGYVVVTGFSENASKLVRHAVQVGDRIVAVASSLGDSMWPVSTVEGVVSACTSRLPGQKVRMRFERPQENMRSSVDSSDVAGVVNPSAAKEIVEQPTILMSPEKQKVLLQRCRDVLKRYSSESKADFVGKYEVPVMVADKVIDAVASATTSLDAVTLSMVINAYLSCDQADKAIWIFEGATGLKADGSSEIADTVISGTEKGMLVPNDGALNLYTASSVLRAYAMKGDLSSAKRILAAMESRIDAVVDGKEVAVWPGAGVTIVPDTICYNIAMSAASSMQHELKDVLGIFQSMADKKDQLGVPAKDLVSYNTVIVALTNAGRAEDAFRVFNEMKAAGIKPDKFTYTSLIKSCVSPIDMQELLYDMKERGVKPDIVTYNTMIRTLCDRLQWYEAKKMITDMESNGIAPNSMTYGFLMSGLMKAEKYSACVALFESACADARTMPLAENVHLYTTAIAASASLRNHEKAFHLINRMNMAGVRPNIKTLTAVMSACLSSEKSSLAVDVYRQIQEPDAKAMTKGVEAMCLEGLFDEAAALLHQQWRTRGSVLSGKEVMQGYDILLREALKQGNLATARSTLKQFLASGFIPSKAMYQTIVDALGLAPPRKKDQAFAKDIPEESFDFLLFVLDSIRERNLSCDGAFYTSVLLCSSRMGGLRRKLGSLMAEARALTGNNPPKAGDGNVGWEDLLKNYDMYKESDKNLPIPCIGVNVNKALVRSVLYAEQQVTYNGRKASSKTSKAAKSVVLSK